MALGMTRPLPRNPLQPSSSAPGLSNVYDAATTQQAQDYDDIMRGYDDLLKTTKSDRSRYTSLNPATSSYFQVPAYSRSADLNTAIGGLKDFSRTGGYSEGDISNIRERGISPIRSIYANAQRNLARQKVLQGGYSPNYGAVSARMARDLSSQIGDITTRVNADVAQMIASGKLAGLQSLSPVVSRENELINQTKQKQGDVKREALYKNADERNRLANTELAALSGKQSLYGTTPALSQTFANQVLANNSQKMQAVQTANAIKNQRANLGINLLQLGRG